MIKKTHLNESTNKVIAVIIYVLYGIAAIVSIICIFTDWISPIFSKIQLTSNSSAWALGRLYGYMLLAILPSLFLFLANKAPIRINKIIQVLFWFLGVIGMIGLTVLFFYISSDKIYSNALGATVNDMVGILWLRIGLIATIVEFIIIYILCHIEISFTSIKLIPSLIEWMSERYHGQAIYLISTLLLPLIMPLSYVVVAFAGYLISTFILLIIIYIFWDCDFSSPNNRKKYTFTNDRGCEQTVYSDNGKDFYSDSGSYVGYSDDNGKTINER